MLAVKDGCCGVTVCKCNVERDSLVMVMSNVKVNV